MAHGLQGDPIGAIIYFVPFFFVLNAALLFIGARSRSRSVTLPALIGVAVLANGLQGYVYPDRAGAGRAGGIRRSRP